MSTTPEQFLDTYLDAVNSADPAAVKALYTDDARVFDAMGAWEYAGPAWPAQIDTWLGMVRPGGHSTVTTVESSVSADLAVVHATITYSSQLTDGSTGEVTLRLTMVLTRTADGWRIAHEHTSFPVTMSEDPRVIEYAAGPA